MSVTVHIEGLAELQRRLLELPARVERHVVHKAVAAGGRLIRDEARARAPVYTGDVAKGHPPPGTLKRAIWTKYIPERSKNGLTTYFVGVLHGKKMQKRGKKQVNLDAYYWWFVEFGTVKMPAHPFMRPAFDARESAAANAIIDELRQGISEQVASL